MPVSLPLTDRISQGSGRKRVYKTLSANFGDGYSQDAPDGINSTKDTWSIAYEGLDSTDRSTVVAALDAVGGSDYFTWTPIGAGASLRFKLTPDGWSETWQSGDLCTIAFSLRQVY